MTSLWTSDLHLDNVERNQYRWDILQWLEKQATQREVDFIGLGGDITDAKDCHSASIVNRLVNFFANSKHQWLILKGNHDFVNPSCPFFGFLDHLDNVTWISNPAVLDLPIGPKYSRTLLLPATKDWQDSWAGYAKSRYSYIFMHGTFAGTLSENGYPLPGIPVDFFHPDHYGKIFAGDIHTPGSVTDRIEYIGAPYRVRFGDLYTPRVIFISKLDIRDLHPTEICARHVLVVRNADDFDKFPEVRPGDQVKIRARIKRSDFPEWRRIRNSLYEAATQRDWEVCGIELAALAPVRRRLEEAGTTPLSTHKTPQEYLREYATLQKFDDAMTNYGLQLL